MGVLDMDGKRAELNALVAFVDRPRRLGAIVAHADRPLHAVRGQLIALCAAGRLKHPEHGFFAPAGFSDKIIRRPKEHRASGKGSSLATQVLSLVDAPKSERDLAARVGKRVATVHRLLSRLIEQGHLYRPVSGVVAPVDFDLSTYVPAEKIEDPSVVNLAIKVCLTEPRRPAEISARLGVEAARVRSHLNGLARTGQVVRIGYALYALPDARPSAMASPVRSQPIRDAILAYVAEPRRACEIAEHIIRPIATTTAHLSAMKRRGLVVQTERGVYVRANRNPADLKQLQMDIAA